MNSVEADILSTPSILRQVAESIKGARVVVDGPVVFLGCGTSHYVGMAMAGLYEATRRLPAQAILPSDYIPRPDWMHIAISRTGKTTELVEAMTRAREAGARILLLVGDAESPAAALATETLPLPFAPEHGIIQTRFISAALLALRLLIGGTAAPEHLPESVERALSAFDPTPLLGFDHTVFLGRGWRYGLAACAALNQQETALVTPAACQTLDYRHGPIACADAGVLVWSLDDLEDMAGASVLDDVRTTGATVHQLGGDPQIALVLAQLLAVRMAQARGVDPDAPRNLSRAIVLPAHELPRGPR